MHAPAVTAPPALDALPTCMFTEANTKIASSLLQFYKDGSFCDVVIVTDSGKKLRCHRVLLASASSKLAAALQDEDFTMGQELVLKGVNGRAMEAIIGFFYSGVHGHWALGIWSRHGDVHGAGPPSWVTPPGPVEIYRVFACPCSHAAPCPPSFRLHPHHDGAGAPCSSGRDQAGCARATGRMPVLCVDDAGNPPCAAAVFPGAGLEHEPGFHD